MSTPFSKLLHLWRERDEIYALRKSRGIPQPLTFAEQDAVRSFRRLEAIALPHEDDQERALSALARWTAPRMAGL